MRRVARVLCVVVAVLLGMTTTTSSPTAAQVVSPAASPAALPPLLAAWASAVNAGEVDQVLALSTDDALWEEVAIGLAAQGPDEIGTHLDRYFMAAPDTTLAVTSSLVAGERALVDWVVSGTSTADFPACHPPPASASRSRGPSVFELADGKIRRDTEYWDAYVALVQLGALPASGTAATPTP